MVGLFVDQIVRCQEAEYRPIISPVDPHPTRGAWVNEGVSAYQEAFGAADYEQFSRHDIPFPMPEDGLSERFKQWRMVLKAKFGFGLKALLTGRRATHMQGIGTRGTITVVAQPEFPEHEFFSAGRVFPCRLRHANASFYDDACSQVRACTLKFADSDFASPLDIPMNTGVIQAFWSFISFMAFVDARVKCREHFWEPQREWLRRWPGAFVGIVESVRAAPASYAEMLYHSCIMFPFRARDGRNRYAKYRLVPCGMTQESGFLSAARQRNPWVQSREPGDDRPRQYLPDEYRQRLQSGPVEYLLQIQVREFHEDRDTWEFFNSARVWDLETSPWLDLAQVRITETLPDDVTDRTRMWLGHQPPSLGLTDSFSPVDYRSMAGARYRVYPIRQHMRWLLRTLGWQRRWPGDF